MADFSSVFGWWKTFVIHPLKTISFADMASSYRPPTNDPAEALFHNYKTSENNTCHDK
jgi:hypothetical protein